MRTSTLTLIVACILLVVDAAPLGARGSVEHLTTENQTDHVAEATPPPWWASSFVEMRVAQPTPPPWRRSMEAEAMGGSSQKGRCAWLESCGRVVGCGTCRPAHPAPVEARVRVCRTTDPHRNPYRDHRQFTRESRCSRVEKTRRG
ncbi:hypothetical protein B0H14DRAFT_1041905 [Mycena olivaceomarginata]|nr:hypothetical protein B0H14DRAFT_1041905 [Mycena olivaceomarginata]